MSDKTVILDAIREAGVTGGHIQSVWSAYHSGGLQAGLSAINSARDFMDGNRKFAESSAYERVR